MTPIKLYNTATRSKVDFTPLDPKNVRMYVCGPTVYDRAHLGNARPVLVFDVLFRLLRHVYGVDHVTYVRNFTDVDDKINATALSRKAAGAKGTLEQLIDERAEETIGWYLADMGALGAMEPNAMPRATAYIQQMITMIEGLIADGFAYAKDGHVLFRVRKYEDYGKLSGRSVDDMIAGARVEVAPYKEDPMDFVLWKPSDEGLPGWESPWGRGRPGWHIECSAMAADLLGESFDIHGGGNDLTFPHHENEIAQSKCCGHDFAQIWMHNEMLQVEGKKMSKSLGNFFTVRDLLEQGVPGEVIRFVMLSTHYRKPMDWTEKKRSEAETTLRKWRNETKDYQPSAIDSSFLQSLIRDLDTHGSIAVLKKLFKSKNYGALLASSQLLGLLLPGQGEWAYPLAYSEEIGKKLDVVMKAWGNAVAEQDYEKADYLRSRIEKAAVKFDRGLRVTDPLAFVRSLTEAEKVELSVPIDSFLLRPNDYHEEVERIMSARADVLLEETV